MLGEAPEIILPPFTVDIWENDQDVVNLRCHFDSEKRKVWEQGIDAFEKGDWQHARVIFDKILELTDGKDGPAIFLRNKMKERNFVSPSDWRGFRKLY